MLTEGQEIAAHDLKNVLTSTQLLIDLAQTHFEQVQDGEEGSASSTFARGVDYLRQARQSCRRMIFLLHELLDASAGEQSLSLKKEYADVSAIAREVMAMNASTASAKNITLQLSTAVPCCAEIDGYRMRDAIDNLVGNAIKYSLPDSAVRLSVLADHEGFVCIEVRDEGLGLTPEDLAHTFSRYQRLSARPTGGESSTGLGLALTERIVALHGGTLSVTSKGRHQGSTFRIRIPGCHCEPKGNHQQVLIQ